MTEIAYYALELVKFMVIYLLGLSMRLTADRRRRLAAVCLVAVTGVFMHYLKLSPVYPALYFLFSILSFYLLIEQATRRNVIRVFWSMGVIFSVDTISYVLVRLFRHITHYHLNQWQDLCASVFTILILGIVFGVIAHNQKTALRELSAGYYIAFLVICVVNASILVLVERELMNVHGEFSVIYIMLVLSSLVQMAFVFVLASSNNWHHKNEKLKEQYLAMQTEHYRYLEERNLDTKKFRHDLRGHILVVKEYIHEEKWDDLGHYIDRVCGEIEHIPGYLSVKNETVDAILNYYNAQFTKRDCAFEVKGSLPQRCYVQAYDLCTIFSNLLSNALESVEKLTQKGEVELSVHFDDALIYIREKNTCSGSLNRNGEEIVTSKQDKELHGFGIRNIRDSVKRYSGTVDIEVLGHSFVYNTSEGKYELLKGQDINSLQLDKEGKYLITERKLTERKGSIVALIAAIVIVIILLGVYIGVKKQYWFW